MQHKLIAQCSTPGFFQLHSFCLLIVLSLPFFTLADTHADSQPIYVTQQGSLQVHNGDGQWQSIEKNRIELPIALKTGSDGSAVIQQGDTSITMNPGSELSLHATAARSSGFISLIKQKIGSAIYKVEKHPGDFRVETPYLVSVVKGTRFSVVASRDNAFVTVTEGLVEVSDLRSGDITMVSPGEVVRSSALRTRAPGREVQSSGIKKLRPRPVDKTSAGNIHKTTANGLDKFRSTAERQGKVDTTSSKVPQADPTKVSGNTHPERERPALSDFSAPNSPSYKPPTPITPSTPVETTTTVIRDSEDMRKDDMNSTINNNSSDGATQAL